MSEVVVQGSVVSVGSGADRGGLVVGEVGQPGSQDPVMDPDQEQGPFGAGGGEPVAVGAGDAFDDTVGAQAPQVVGHLPGGDGLGRSAEQGREQGAQVAVGESAGQEPEDQQGVQQGLDAAGRRNAGRGYDSRCR